MSVIIDAEETTKPNYDGKSFSHNGSYLSVFSPDSNNNHSR
jgi:hypothetical protein